MFKKISAFCFCVLIGFSSSVAFASGYSTEADVLLPWSWLSSSLNSAANQGVLKQEFTIDNLVLNAQVAAQNVPIHLPQIKANLALKLRPWMQSESNGAVHSSVETEKIEVQFEISPISIHQEITQRINGVNLIVQVDVQCSQLVLKQDLAAVKAQVLWRSEMSEGTAKLAAHLESLDLAWPASSWQISLFQCQGPSGITDFIRNEILQKLADPNSLAPFVKEKMQTLLTAQLQSIHQKIAQLRPVSALETVAYKIQDLKNISNDGLIYKMNVQVESADASTSSPSQASTLTQFPKGLLVPSLYIEKENFEKLIAASLTSKATKINLREVSGFNRLMRSRFMQFFLWPDLMNFPKHTAFDLISKSSGQPKVKINSNNEISLDMTLDSWMQGDRDNQRWNYIFLRSQVSLKSQITLENKQLTLDTEVQEFKNSYSFGPEYKAKYRPRSYISVSTMESAVQSSILDGKKLIPLPSFDLGNGQKIDLGKIQKLNNTGLLIQALQ